MLTYRNHVIFIKKYLKRNQGRKGMPECLEGVK